MSVNGLNMMKRQFLRVKQIADQTFQRGEKTELLNDELTAAEKRVDLIKQSCQSSGKKLSSCTQRLASDTVSSERRNNRRVPEAQLAQCMEEFGLGLGEGSILGITLVDCARVQDALASDLLAYKADVETTVVEPLQNILKVDIANIAKYRKQLAKLTTEMDASKLRHQTAVKNCQQVSTNNLATAVAKADSLKEETEDAAGKVEQCRDGLAAEMFNLISREPELAQLFVKLCHLQLEYHRSALSVLESSVPEMEAQISSYPFHPVFGQSLESHLLYSNREIAVVIETCVCWLLDRAMSEEGLFRIGGSITKIKKLKNAFDAGVIHLIEDERDPHNVAGVLKSYLRSLPEPLLTHSLYNDWIEAAKIRDHGAQLQALWKVVNSLPAPNLKNLKYLIKFLSKLCQNSEVNKMSSQNIAIVMGPNLLWSPVEENALGMNMTATNLHSSIVDTLITYSDWFFPGECEFYLSTPTSPRHLNGLPSSLRGSQLSLSTTKLSNGDSAVDSLSSSPTNSPKSPSPRVITRSKKKPAPAAPCDIPRNGITRSVSCSVFSGKTTEDPLHPKRFSSHQSISHENLLAANYNQLHQEQLPQHEVPPSQKSTAVQGQETNESGKSHPVPITKPARSRSSALPPLVERTRTRIERPSIPPPERPSSVKIAEEPVDAVDSTLQNKAEDASPSNKNMKCTEKISYMDDSDFEEENITLTPVTEQHDEDADSSRNYPHGAGTPKWFDHYNCGRRESNSLWFNLETECEELLRDVNVEKDDDVFQCADSPESHDDSDKQYCTIIPVGEVDETLAVESEDSYQPLYKFSPPQDTSIKLRVNSDSQNTRL